MKIAQFDTVEAFVKASVKKIPNGTIALSGGSTPEPIYAALGQTAYADKQFFQVDERYVPADDPNSNQRMIRQHLPNLHTFDTSLPIEECLTAYEKELNETRAEKQFDLVILGIGPDGHIASLFPNSPALHEKTRPVAHTTTDEFAVHDRLTLTLPPILNAKAILVLLKGEEKTEILNELQNSDKTMDELPAKALLDHPNLTIHLCTGS